MNNLIYIKPATRHSRVDFDETNKRAGGINSANELERNEIVMGTDPLDFNSRLQIESITGPDSDKFLITWSSITGKTYVVEKSVDLIDWTELGNVIAGEGDKTTFSDSNIDGSDNIFYRIKLLQ